MTSDWEDALFALCPIIYRENDKTLMMYGFCYDMGWLNLTINYSLKLEKLARKQRHPKVQVAQAKEKFGTCNIYLTNGTKEMYNLMYELEEESRRTCESCGKSNNLIRPEGPGWIRTLCEECKDRRNTKLKF